MAPASFLITYDPVADSLQIGERSLRPSRRTMTAGGVELHLLGHPIAKGRRSDDAVVQAYIEAKNIESFARSLDGSFLIIVYARAERALRVITDRFAGYNFYWTAQNGRLTGSLFLIELIRTLGSAQIDLAAMLEFLHFRRLFGEKTYDRRCSFLTSAGILEVGVNGHSVHKYWQPDYSTPRLDERCGRDAIVEGLRGAMRMHMEGANPSERYALLLSGGLDLRALLAAAKEPPLCVTTCATFNNEAEVAQEVALAAGAKFEFVPRPATPYDHHIGDAVWYGGGQHLLSEAHFIGYDSKVSEPDRCFFLGLGLDIFLGGLYLPKDPVRWLGRETLHHELRPLGGDVASAFMDGVKYRLKTDDPWSVVAAPQRADMRDAVRASIAGIVERGKALGARQYDLWEFLHLHNLSRHYSFLMIQSIRHWTECRAPALCNDLLDVAVRLPASLKANSTAYLAALKALSPALSKIRNANTNIAAGVSLRMQSSIRAARKASNVFGGSWRVSPASSERSWPSPREIVTVSSELQSAIGALPRSERLAALGVFDLDQVRAQVESHSSGRRDSSMMLLVLLTMDEFLRQVQ